MDLSGQNSISIILKKLEKILVLLFIAFLFIGFRNSVYAGVDINKKAEKNKVAVVASNLNNNIENTISSKNIILVGFLSSFTFEVCQFIFALGASDITDIITNTITTTNNPIII